MSWAQNRRSEQGGGCPILFFSHLHRPTDYTERFRFSVCVRDFSTYTIIWRARLAPFASFTYTAQYESVLTGDLQSTGTVLCATTLRACIYGLYIFALSFAFVRYRLERN